MRKEDDDGQKKRIKVLLSAVLRDDGIRNTEREKEIYIQHFDANRLHSEKRWIQSNSMDLLFFFSFSPFYLLLSQRRTFFNILPFETRRREEKRRKGGERGGGGRERRLFNKEERQNLSLRVFGLKLFWRSFRAKFLFKEEEEKSEKKFTKVI